MSTRSTPDAPESSGADVLRRAVAALRDRMSLEYGELVPAASVQRTAALADKLERLSALPPAERAAESRTAIDAADLATLDSWIRAADGFTLHDDAAEAAARAEIGRRLRAVRELVAPEVARLTEDPRDD